VAIGNAVATGAGALPFKKIIHTVAPVWCEDDPSKIVLLKSSINNSFELAGVLGLKSLALPAIASGALCFPKDLCAQCFMEQVLVYANKKSR
jgi:O-acetyl-ADP-ribose deacetylase (regulator of RNase III)